MFKTINRITLAIQWLVNYIHLGYPHHPCHSDHRHPNRHPRHSGHFRHPCHSGHPRHLHHPSHLCHSGYPCHLHHPRHPGHLRYPGRPCHLTLTLIQVSLLASLHPPHPTSVQFLHSYHITSLTLAPPTLHEILTPFLHPSYPCNTSYPRRSK